MILFHDLRIQDLVNFVCHKINNYNEKGKKIAMKSLALVDLVVGRFNGFYNPDSFCWILFLPFLFILALGSGNCNARY